MIILIAGFIIAFILAWLFAIVQTIATNCAHKARIGKPPMP